MVLRPYGYQYDGRGAGSRDYWDANWLLIRGEVRTSTGDAWSFHDACLTTREAVELLAWLRAASQGRIAATDVPTEGAEGLLAFTEPNLAFSLAGIDDRDLVLRVHLSHESARSRPDTGSDAPWELNADSIPLSMTRAGLLSAADEWQADIADYPER